MDIAGIIAILSSLLGIPLIVFGFIYLNIKSKREVEMMKIKKDMMQLEIERERLNLQMLDAENVKYDRLIEEKERITRT